MTHEELVERIAAGEESLIADLWSQVEKFVAWRANRFFYSYMERCQSLVIDTDDLIQVGYFALLQSVEKYDPARGTKFLTAFEYYLKTQFFTLAKMRHTGWYKNPIHRCEHLDEAISNTEGLTLADTIASETDEIAETEHEAYIRTSNEAHGIVASTMSIGKESGRRNSSADLPDKRTQRSMSAPSLINYKAPRK